MQTFLPYNSFTYSARVLDMKRCGKQRVEARQLVNALTQEKKNGWRNHPAARMWVGYVEALKLYTNIMIAEWVRRGYNNNMPYYRISGPLDFPPWFGDEMFHASHRAALLYKDYNFYSKYGWQEEPKVNYIWPVLEEL